MASKDDSNCYSIATGKKGKDENGKYEIYEIHREVPCGHHPETCGCSGRSWVTNEYKKYNENISKG